MPSSRGSSQPRSPALQADSLPSGPPYPSWRTAFIILILGHWKKRFSAGWLFARNLADVLYWPASPAGLALERVRLSSSCPPHSPCPGTPAPCPGMAGEPWTVTATSRFCIARGVFQEPPVPQEGPGGAFWSPSLPSIQGKAGRAPAEGSRRQPHPSQTPFHVVLTSMVFLTSYPEGLANWVSSHRPRGIPTVLSPFNCLCLLSRPLS